MNYAQYVNDSSQLEPVPGKNMSKNNAGGYAFKIDKWQMLDRFLIMGSESGTYYVSERDLTKQNFANLDACLAEDFTRVIERTVQVSQEGLAPKNEAALFVLAKACADRKYSTCRRFALSKLPEVARTGTHLFHFVRYAKAFRGWGRAYKRAVANWYKAKSTQSLAYQLYKYKQRDGWSHRDVIRLAHVKETDNVRNALLRKVVKGDISLAGIEHPALDFVKAAEEVSSGKTSVSRAAQLIKAHRLPREVVSTGLLDSCNIWHALLFSDMPMTALIRNLGKMSSIGLLDRYGVSATHVISQLTNADLIKKARIHPITVLSALRVYRQGHGVRGSLKWDANQDIVDALDQAFYESIKQLTPTNKRLMIALDVSGSMFWTQVNGLPGLSAATVSAAMAMITLRVEPNCMIKSFGSSFGSSRGPWHAQDTQLSDINISKHMSLTEVIKNIDGLNFGRTDCALPMVWARENKQKLDGFIVYTDSETWVGNEHPFEALQSYRQKSGIHAKLVVAGTAATDISIADPQDGAMLDVVGFDSSAPKIISDFLASPVPKA